MSRIAHKLLSASGGDTGYEIDQSLMFDRGDTAYLVRAAASITDGNHTTFTYSTWVKRVQVGSNDVIFNVRASNGAGVTFMVYFPGTEQTLYIFQKDSGGNSLWYLQTNKKFRDVGAWYHIVVAVDTTQGTEADRVKLYINGTQETSFTGSSSYPSQNLATPVNDGVDHQIGYNAAGSLDGYMAETYLIDGTAQAVSAFGETDSETGEWIPKKYTGSFGNNGVYLKYASGAIGTDSSGEGNNYTATNVGNGDVLLDTPTNNFPIVNTLEPYNTTISTFRQGTLNIKGSAYSSGNYGNHHMTFILPTSGKWYVEMLTGVQAGSGNVAQLGVNKQGPSGIVIPNQAQLAVTFGGTTGLAFSTYANTADLYDGGSSISQATGLTATEYVCALAIDVDNGKVYAGYNSGSSITWLNSGNPAGNSNGAAHTFDSNSIIYTSVSSSSDNANRSYVIMNFGQNGTFSNYQTAGGNADGNGIGNFFYAPPTGFKALCTKNLATPGIKDSSAHFNTLLYTGNDADDRTLTGVGFQPDLVWIKTRDTTNYHQLMDSVRGVSKRLNTNNNNTEFSDSDPNNSLVAFTSDGFTVDDSSGYSDLNASAHNYVAWNWKAGGSGSSNTDGTINTISTSVNTTAGFSISTYTGTGSNATVGHGLGAVPATMWIKNRDTNDNWRIYSNEDPTDYMAFNWTGASTDDNTSWNDTAPTSYTFSIGTDTNTNRSGDKFIAYCFAEVEGFSSFGTYLGNGASEDGPFIYTGFKPRLVIVKKSSAAGSSWFMWDSLRHPENVIDLAVWVGDINGDTSHAEYEIDFLSNGFKIRGQSAGSNASGATHVYMAFAEAPFKYATAR